MMNQNDKLEDNNKREPAMHECLSADEALKKAAEVRSIAGAKIPYTNMSVSEIEKLLCTAINNGVVKGYSALICSIDMKIKEEDVHALEKIFTDRGYIFQYRDDHSRNILLWPANASPGDFYTEALKL